MSNQQRFGLYVLAMALLCFLAMMLVAQQSAPRTASEKCIVVTTTAHTAPVSRVETCEIIKEYVKK